MGDNMEAREPLSEIDRMKELFEYEMTGVLLSFQQEVSDGSNSLIREYMEMEIRTPGINYQSPDIKITEVPAAAIPQISIRSTKTASRVDIASTLISQEVPASLSVTGFHPERQTVALQINLPKQAEKPLTFPQHDASVQSDISFETTKIAGIPLQFKFSPSLSSTKSKEIDVKVHTSVPKKIRKIRNILTHSDALSVKRQLPDTNIHTKFSLKSDSISQSNAGSVQVTLSDITIRNEVFSIPELPDVHLSFLEQCTVSSFKGIGFETQKAEGSMLDLNGTRNIPTDIGCPAAFTGGVEIERNSFPKVRSLKIDGTKPDLSVAVETVQVQVEVSVVNGRSSFNPPMFSCGISHQIEYPKIPEKPDFSEYYKSIFDSVRSEL